MNDADLIERLVDLLDEIDDGVLLGRVPGDPTMFVPKRTDAENDAHRRLLDAARYRIHQLRMREVA